MKSVCVFCGSSPGNNPVYAAAAKDMGQAIARRGLTLVYGGGRVGLMGIVADAALAAGGIVHGIIPAMLDKKEVGHSRLTHLEIVDTMHERKARMAELSDGFIAMPGGIGTLEEIFEIWTWSQLGIHAKPLGFLDIAGYYAPLDAFLDGIVAAGFLRPTHRAMAHLHTDPEGILDAFGAHTPVVETKWMTEAQI